MAQITKLFTKGLDTDTAPHLQEKESYSSAMNVHFSLGSLLGVSDGQSGNMSGYNIGGDLGVLEPFAGNTDWTTLFSTLIVQNYDIQGAKCIGYATDDTESISDDTRFIYLFIYTPASTPPNYPYPSSYIIKVAIKYNSTNKVNQISIADSSILLSGAWVLGPNNDNIGFLGTYFVSARVSGNQLIWTDGVNPIRYVDVNKDYLANNPTINELSLITEPGHIPLVSVRGDDVTKSTSIQKKGLQFTYRIINEDNFTSVLAPYSLTSLPPWQEQLDVSNYVDNIITISLSKQQLIPDNWKKVDIVVRYLDTNIFQVIRSINKYDNTVRTYDFGFGTVNLTDAQLVADHNDPGATGIYITYQDWDGSNIVETLDAAYSAKQFDNVPIRSKSLEYASSRLFLANNLEGYDTPDTLITLSSAPAFTSSYTTPESLYPSIDQDPFYIAIKANGTDSWNWCVVTQIPVSGGYEYYLYPTSASVGLFPNSVVPAVTSGAGFFVTTSFNGFSTTNFMTLPQNISIDNMRKLTFSWNMNLGTLLNHYPVNGSTEANVLSSIMSEVNTSYSGSWATHTDFGVTFAQMIVLRYVQRNGSTTYDNLSGIYDSATYNVSASNRAFLPGTTYSYGMTFYDEALRKCGIQRLGSVEVPEYYPDTRTLYTGLQFDLNATQVLPTWAKYYSLDFSKNNTMNDFISFVPDIIKFAYKDRNNVVVFDQSEITTTNVYYGVAIPIGSLNKDGLGYAFAEGDVCKFVIYDSLTSSQQLFIGSIIDQQSGYIIVSIPQATIKPYLSLQNNQQTIYLGSNHKCVYGDATSLTPRYQSNIIAYVYTPQSVVNQEYEIAGFGEVIDPVTLGDFFSTSSLSYTISGDTYTQARNADAGSLTCVSMNPYEKAYTVWLTDLGRYTPIDNIGQKDLTNQIRWSNVKIPNSNSNGLATFDALDVSDVDSSVGPITSIILSTKEANLASRLVILCNSGSFIGLIGQAQIYSQDQSSAFLSSAPVIGTIQPITGQWGCISPQGVISYKGMVFWADALNREIIQLAGDGATPISQQKAGFLWNQVFRNLPFDDSAISAINIKIGINPYTSEIFVTCPVPNITPSQFPANCGENRLNQYVGDKKVSYVYHYQLNKWVGAYEDNPDQWIRLGDDVFTVGSQYGTTGLKLYKEFDSTPGDFNQLTTPSCYISFPISEGYPATIEPLSVILMGQLETTNTVVYARDSSTSVNNNLTQVTCWNDSNYATREGEKFAPVLRNRLSNNAGQSQVLSITPLVTGSGYLTAPLVTIGPPTLSGGTQATATAVLTSGSVTSYIITNPGTGYTSTPSISVAPPPSGVTATATISVGIAATNTFDYQGIKGDRIRSKTPWVQVTFPAEQQINFQGARVEVKTSSGH
jgi:hypothetical protein